MKIHVEVSGVITRLFLLGNKQRKEKGKKKSIPDSFWDAIIRNHLWNECDARKRSRTDCIVHRASWGLYTGNNDLLCVVSSFHDRLLSCCSFSRMKPSRSTIISAHMITEHSDPETVIKLTAKPWGFLFSLPPPSPFPLSISSPWKSNYKGNSPTSSNHNPDSPLSVSITSLLHWFYLPAGVSSAVHTPVSMETDSSVGRAIWTQPSPNP